MLVQPDSRPILQSHFFYKDSRLKGKPRRRSKANSLGRPDPLALEPFLRSYTTAVEAHIAMVSISYDIATNQLERHKKIIDITNFIFLKIGLD